MVQIRHQVESFASSISIMSAPSSSDHDENVDAASAILLAGFGDPAHVGFVPPAYKTTTKHLRHDSKFPFPTSTPTAPSTTGAAHPTTVEAVSTHNDDELCLPNPNPNTGNPSARTAGINSTGTFSDVSQLVVVVTSTAPVRAVTPGQAVAFYDMSNTVCLGGGTIIQTGPTLACDQ
jgi:hypothetical protein